MDCFFSETKENRLLLKWQRRVTVTIANWSNIKFCHQLWKWVSPLFQVIYCVKFHWNPSISFWINLLNMNVTFLKSLSVSNADIGAGWVMFFAWKKMPSLRLRCDGHLMGGDKGDTKTKLGEDVFRGRWGFTSGVGAKSMLLASDRSHWPPPSNALCGSKRISKSVMAVSFFEQQYMYVRQRPFVQLCTFQASLWERLVSEKACYKSLIAPLWCMSK